MFGFIAEVNSTTRFLEESHQLPLSDERVFIVPAMLPLDLPSNIKLPDDKNADARIIYFKFSEEFVPQMVFYQMLGTCISRNIEKKDSLHCIRRHMIKMVLGRYQIYYVTLSESHHSIKLAIVPGKDALSSQSRQERWELIEEFNDKLIERVKAFMPASHFPQRYIPCCSCPELHLNLNEIRANDKPLQCFHGDIPEDYYFDLRRNEGVHQINEAKLTDNFDCSTAQKNIRENYDEMTHLPINSMLNKLYSKDVITLDQKKRIKACPVETEQMEYLLDNIIIPSLQCDNIRKFKGLFEIMKDSGDSTLTATAEKLSNH